MQLNTRFIHEGQLPPDAAKVRVVVEADGVPCDMRSFEHPTGARLAEFEGIVGDLEAAKNYCQRILTDENVSTDALLLSALFETALMRYRRCFTSGVRQRLKTDVVFGGTQNLVGVHDRLIALADCHIAHSVNDMEGYAPYVALSDKPFSPTVAFVGALHYRQRHPDSGTVRELFVLVSQVLSVFALPAKEKFLAAYREAVLSLSREHLATLPELEVSVNKSLAKPRSRR